MSLLSTSFFKKALLVISIGCSAIYVLAAAAAYVNPKHFMPFTFLALLFPFLLVGMLLLLILFILFHRKYTWLPAIAIIIGFKSILSTTGFHFKKAFHQQKEQNAIRVLSWNVDEFVDSRIEFDTTGNHRRKIMSFITKVNPDIMCLQDFREYADTCKYFSNIAFIRDSLHYPYCYFSSEDSVSITSDKSAYGVAIFSRYPIVNAGKWPYTVFPPPTESLAHIKVAIGSDTLMVYSTHLLSMNLGFSTPKELHIQSLISDQEAVMDRGKFGSIRFYDKLHAQQALFIKEKLNQSPQPFIFCADMNAVPSSYVYHCISDGLGDAFLQCGTGWGTTYDAISPTLRIDVALMSPQLKAVQYFSPKLYASDHFPVVTDIMFKR